MAKRISRVELHTMSHKKAMAFYGPLFGWKLGGENEGYFQIVEDPADRRFVFLEDGRNVKTARWLPVIEVDDVGETLHDAEELGAREVFSASVGEYTLGFITDPDGAEFSIMERSNVREEEEDQIFGRPIPT